MASTAMPFLFPSRRKPLDYFDKKLFFAKFANIQEKYDA